MKPPPIQWLLVFAKAAEHKSFRKAAEQLNVSPPAVSQKIKSLEDYLGIPLFKRKGPRLELSEAGEFYYLAIQSMLKGYISSFEEFDRRFYNRSLRLNAPLFIAQEILIPNYLGYKKREPKAELRITTGTEYIDFESNVADAAIRFGMGEWPSLNSELLCQVTATPICSSANFKYESQDYDSLIEILKDQTLLTTDESAKDWQSLFPELEPKEIIVCDSYFSVIKSAEMGLGVALGLFPAINGWVNQNKFKLMSKEQFEIEAAYWFVYPKQRTENRLIGSCFEWAKGLFDSLPPLE
jgi:LysR family glycine cleavage system transcriptional activator